MGLADELGRIADCVRQAVDDDLPGVACVHEFRVRTRVWGGPRLGEGTYTDTDMAVTPCPRVVPYETRQKMTKGGSTEQGDLRVAGVSTKYSQEELADNTVTPWPARTEMYWLVDNQPYDVYVTDRRVSEWRVILRRRRA